MKNIRMIAVQDVYRLETTIVQSTTTGGPQQCTFITLVGLKMLLCRSRKVNAKRLAHDLGIEVVNTMCVPVETNAVEFLRVAFEGVSCIPQYAVGPYHIDLYFDVHRVAVECDEASGHGRSRAASDLARQSYIEEKTGCTFVRFRPDVRDHLFMARVVRDVLRAIEGSKARI